MLFRQAYSLLHCLYFARYFAYQTSCLLHASSVVSTTMCFVASYLSWSWGLCFMLISSSVADQSAFFSPEEFRNSFAPAIALWVQILKAGTLPGPPRLGFQHSFQKICPPNLQSILNCCIPAGTTAICFLKPGSWGRAYLISGQPLLFAP